MPKALTPADLYKLMGDSGSPATAAVTESGDTVVANVIRERQAGVG